MSEMRVVANNIANLSTTGFRKEGVVFAEFVADLAESESSLSMATAEGRIIDRSQGALTQTGGTFDFAIEGDGYFLIETTDGNQLTRAGSFTPSPDGELVTPDGFRLLDIGGAPIFVPAGLGAIAMAQDGTLSAGGNPIAQVGLYLPSDPDDLVHRGGTRFSTDGGVDPHEGGTVFQGFLENSNVNPVREIARMIEVQRAYEMGQSFIESEDKRIRSVIQSMSR